MLSGNPQGRGHFPAVCVFSRLCSYATRRSFSLADPKNGPRQGASRQCEQALMNNPQSASMYESATKIYPREIGGRFANLSKIATVTLLGLFYALPWLNWAERQAVLFDLPARKFHLLGLTLWPQDFPYLAL